MSQKPRNEIIAFVKFLVDNKVLKFGSFTLKSGRQSPYFLNLGEVHTGSQIARLGDYYAETITANKLNPAVIFGPAYKGIPLAVATSASLYDVGFTFNRKEAKDHGEGGRFVGASVTSGTRVVVVDDVITSGKALGEALLLLREVKADVVGVVIAVDREEKGTGELSAVAQVTADFGVPVFPIITLSDIITALESGEVDIDNAAEVAAKLKNL